jgi:hypothetical protein
MYRRRSAAHHFPQEVRRMRPSCLIRRSSRESRTTAEQLGKAKSGGYGSGPNDRGIRVHYERVRDNFGRWEYPRHVLSAEFSLEPCAPWL